MWDRRKVQAKWSYFRAQRLHPTGNFAEFVVRVYYTVLVCCMEGDGRSCPAGRVRNRRLSHFVYHGIYDQPDHDYDMVLEDCKRNLVQMGYLHWSEDKTRIFVDRPLDFLLEGEHARYLAMAQEAFCAPAEPAEKQRAAVQAPLPCPECGKPMVLRNGRYGLFFGCSAFPACRCTLSLAEGTYRAAAPERTCPLHRFPPLLEMRAVSARAQLFSLFRPDGTAEQCGRTAAAAESGAPVDTADTGRLSGAAL